MITIQILTKNNEKTIEKTLDSIVDINANIIIGDIGSSDNTLKICSKYNVEIIKFKWENDYSKVRNKIIKDGFNLYIEPWEVLACGHEEVLNLNKSTYFYVINNGIVSKQIRFWEKNNFKNPIYETIVDENAQINPNIILISNNEPNSDIDKLEVTRKWLNSKPTLSDPYYYLACSYLTKRKYKEFFTYANQYLLMENKKIDESSIMLLYYMAQIKLHTGSLQEALKDILTCLSFCPSFAEFWCCLGDIFYKQEKYEKAKSIYENAIIAGKKRIKTDKFPIEISKYQEYPKSMIFNIDCIKEKLGLIIQKQK